MSDAAERNARSSSVGVDGDATAASDEGAARGVEDPREDRVGRLQC